MVSLLRQDYPDVDILIRDDGSEDGTLDILGRYSSFDNVSVCKGRNFGVPRSFFELIQIASPSADYYAFCDQDDIWEKDKISRAIGSLASFPQAIPSLYCSRCLLVDEDLNIIGRSPIPKRGPSFENALVQNIASGCTVVINKAARQLLMREIPRISRMHDWWMYLVIAAFGKVIYDPEPRILYRQHSSNVIGTGSTAIAIWTTRIRRFLKSSRVPLITEQASEFRRIYGSLLPEEKKAVLDRFLDERKLLTGRVRYAFSCEVYRQSMSDDMALRLLIMLNRV